ncbi:hypothetical protein BDN72DRAFT_863712 [Pluteus cervinus]|uniref:Uncharacterized protein n=1 Tax=Pluteus cervinus TaxID=181527 RepID=A0ACD3A6G7_9AGAR|nr:hypothetical protein BDN72DRAFT_863712 [Pluteus cervinus]
MKRSHDGSLPKPKRIRRAQVVTIGQPDQHRQLLEQVHRMTSGTPESPETPPIPNPQKHIHEGAPLLQSGEAAEILDAPFEADSTHTSPEKIGSGPAANANVYLEYPLKATPHAKLPSNTLQLFDSWKKLIPSLVKPLLSYTSSALGKATTPSNDLAKTYCRTIAVTHCSCVTAGEQLVSNGLFPAAPTAPKIAFSVELLEFYRALFEQSCDAVASIATALYNFYHRRGFSILTKRGSLMKDPFRRGLGTAVLWYDTLRVQIDSEVDSAISSFSARTVPGSGVAVAVGDQPLVKVQQDQPVAQELQKPPASTISSFAATAVPDSGGSGAVSNQHLIQTQQSHPVEREPLKPPRRQPRLTLGEAARSLRNRCPACFGHTQWGRSLDLGGDVHIGLDGNFHHRHAVSAGDGPKATDPVWFLPKAQVDGVGRQIEAARKKKPKNFARKVPDAAVDGCQESYEAADGDKKKAATDKFDDNGLMFLVCRHDIPLFFTNIDTPGEQQKYAITLLKHLLSLLPPEATVGAFYDISCVLERSIRLFGLLQESDSKRIKFVTSAMHAYGHQWACQLVYNPRLCHGVGLSDGEGVERLWSRMRKLIGIERASWRSKRLWLIDRQATSFAMDLKGSLGQWLLRRHKRGVQDQGNASSDILLDCNIPVVQLQQEWTAQVAAQSSVIAHAPERLKAEINDILALQEHIETFENSVSTTKSAISKAKVGKKRKSTLEIVKGLEEGYKSLKKQVEALYHSFELQDSFPQLSGRAIGSFFEWDKLDQANGGTKLHQQTRNAISKRTPALIRSIKKFNGYCETLASIKQSGAETIPVPTPLPLALAALRDDSTLMEDVWITPQGEAKPRWMTDLDVRDGIRAMLKQERCQEEELRLKFEAHNLLVWYEQELRGIEGALSDPARSLGQWLLRRHKRGVQDQGNASSDILLDCEIPVVQLQQEWAAQVAAQSSVTAHAPERLKAEINSILTLQEHIETFETSVSTTKSAISKAKVGKKRKSTLKIVKGLEEGYEALKKQVEALYHSFELQDSFPALSGRAIGSFFEWDKLDQANGGKNQALGTKLHQQTRNAISKRTPALIRSIKKFNGYCETLASIEQSGAEAIPVPTPLPLALAALRDDSALMEDVWITPQGEAKPRWMTDLDVRDGIRAMLKQERCQEEELRLKFEAHNLLVWYEQELRGIEGALSDPALSSLAQLNGYPIEVSVGDNTNQGWTAQLISIAFRIFSLFFHSGYVQLGQAHLRRKFYALYGKQCPTTRGVVKMVVINGEKRKIFQLEKCFILDSLTCGISKDSLLFCGYDRPDCWGDIPQVMRDPCDWRTDPEQWCSRAWVLNIFVRSSTGILHMGRVRTEDKKIVAEQFLRPAFDSISISNDWLMVFSCLAPPTPHTSKLAVFETTEPIALTPIEVISSSPHLSSWFPLYYANILLDAGHQTSPRTEFDLEGGNIVRFDGESFSHHARDLKINIRKRAIGSFFEWDKLDQANGGKNQALGTKLHQQTRNAISKRTPALIRSIKKFNGYCETLASIEQSGAEAIPVPTPLPLALAALRDDSALMEDVWITPQGEAKPRWMTDLDVRDGIRAMLKQERCQEEELRLKFEAHNLLVWYEQELRGIEGALSDPAHPHLRTILLQRYNEHLLLPSSWSSNILPLDRFAKRDLSLQVRPGETANQQVILSNIISLSPEDLGLTEFPEEDLEDACLPAILDPDEAIWADSLHDVGVDVLTTHSPSSGDEANSVDTGLEQVSYFWGPLDVLREDTCPLDWEIPQTMPASSPLFKRIGFSSSDLQRLESPTALLNDVCINGGSRLLQAMLLSSSAYAPTVNRCAILTTWDLPRIREDCADEVLWRSTRGSLFWERDVWILPVHRPDQVHWVCCAIYPKERRISLFDSLGSREGWSHDVQDSITLVRRISSLAQLNGYPIEASVGDNTNQSWTVRLISTETQQHNSFDCGVWVLAFIASLLRGYENLKIPEAMICVFREKLHKVALHAEAIRALT